MNFSSLFFYFINDCILYRQRLGISGSSWQQLAPSLHDRGGIPVMEAVDDDKANEEQGTKRKKVVELDNMDTEKANQDQKRRRFWKASLKPPVLPAS